MNGSRGRGRPRKLLEEVDEVLIIFKENNAAYVCRGSIYNLLERYEEV